MRNNDLPLFDVLGRDLLVIHPWRRAVSLAMPFVLAIAFFVFAAYGRWAEAIASYGSTKTDRFGSHRKAESVSLLRQIVPVLSPAALSFLRDRSPLKRWLAALDDFRNWLIHEAA